MSHSFSLPAKNFNKCVILILIADIRDSKCTAHDSNNMNSRLLYLFRQISKYLKVARKAKEDQIVSTRIIMEGGEFPWQHSFPPFFTLQPHQETQRKQLDAWQTIVLGKFEISKPYRIHFPTSKAQKL